MSSTPFLPSSLVLLPMRGGETVVDFWSSFFAVATSEDASHFADFPELVADCLDDLGYNGNTDGDAHLVAFSSGVIGVAREMLSFDNHRARTVLYFKRIQDYGYVSLRVVYRHPFSWLKILRFLAVVEVIVLVLFMLDAEDTYYCRSYYDSYYHSYQYYCPSKADHLQAYFEYTITNRPENLVLLTLGIGLPLGLLWGSFSWWRTGKFLGFLREDFQEIYRDDLASIGQAAYLAITQSADALTLKAIQPDETLPPPPVFGAGTSATPLTRRPRRL